MRSAPEPSYSKEENEEDRNNWEKSIKDDIANLKNLSYGFDPSFKFYSVEDTDNSILEAYKSDPQHGKQIAMPKSILFIHNGKLLWATDSWYHVKNIIVSAQGWCPEPPFTRKF